MSTSQQKLSHAVVIGGSMAGLLAARALADYAARVTIIERDTQLGEAQPRKGVPQGHHIHALLKSGEQILNTFFPGFTAALIANGARQIDFAQDAVWFHHGGWKLRYTSGLHLVGQSRPLLESTVTQFLHKYPNITWKTGWAAQEPLTNPQNTRVTGVRIQHDDGTSEDMHAALVVDASGRGSKTPRWLESMGYAAPQETTVKIDLAYASRVYEIPADFHHRWVSLLVNAKAPDHLRGGYIFTNENNRWMVTLAGYSGTSMPDDDASFLEFARSLQVPDVYEAIKNAKPLTDIKVFRYPNEQRRHYEGLNRFPDGLIVIGDAFCSFDPVFGQGMTSSANQARILHKLLARMSPMELGFSQRFHKQVAGFLFVPWMMATSEDFRFPKTQGKMPFYYPIMHAYTAQIFKLSMTDPQVHLAFARVMNLIAPPTLLFSPLIVLKVIRSLLTRRETFAPTIEPRTLSVV